MTGRPARHPICFQNVWARVDKIDRIRPQPGGGAIVLIEDERNAATMARIPSLSTLIATARILDARRVLELRYRGTGEIRYAAASSPPRPHSYTAGLRITGRAATAPPNPPPAAAPHPAR